MVLKCTQVYIIVEMHLNERIQSRLCQYGQQILDFLFYHK